MKKSGIRKSGVSLIIAIIFVSAFVLVLGGMAEVQFRTIRNIGDVRSEARVADLMESAQELAIFWADRTDTEGKNLTDVSSDSSLSAAITAIAADLGISSCGLGSASACLSLSITGRSGATLSFNGATYNYTVAPMVLADGSTSVRGTGDAGSGCVPVAASATTINDPCFWNKLYVGQTVEIPLYYYDDVNGAVVKANFADSGSDFKVRVRTPCADLSGTMVGAQSAGCSRFTLYPPESSSDYRDVANDPVLVQWTISDADGSDSMVAMNNTAALDSSKRYLTPERNTEISAGRINDAQSSGIYLNNSVVLQDLTTPINTYDRHRGIIVSTSADSEIDNYISTLNKPVLRLTLVGQPQRYSQSVTVSTRNNHSYDIPYLEYQVLSRDTDAIGDSKSYLTGAAQFGNFRKNLAAPFNRAPRLGGFALQSF